jgi:hypothetical protein
MGSKETIHGSYHITLADEINRILTMLKEIGIHDATKLEATALIAEKNKRAKMSEIDVKNFFMSLRGLR